MRTLHAILLLLTLSLPLASKAADIEITIEPIQSVQGQLHLTLWNKEIDFLKQPYRVDSVNAKSGEKTLLLIRDVPAGQYAISVFHDANRNRRLDTGMFRIPTEAYGFSNNARSTFGPPSFADASFLNEAKLSQLLIRLQ